MERSPFSQFSSQGYPYQAPYSQQPQYGTNIQQYSPLHTQQSHSGPYFSHSPLTGTPNLTGPTSTPSQQIQPPSNRHNGHPSASSRVSRTPELSPSARGLGGPPAGTHSLDVTGITEYDESTMMTQADDQEEGDETNDPVGEPIFHLPPPPEAIYPSVEELDNAIHAWSLEHGYELVRRASKKNAKGILYKRYYHCSKHGKLANTGKLTDTTRVRLNRKSNRIGCPMSLAVVAVDSTVPDGPWQLRHRKTYHNHAPLDALALAGHRRRARTGGVEKAVDGLFDIGTSTAQVLQFLQRTNPRGLFTRTDVANMKLKYKKNGTCADRKEPGQPDLRGGLASACRNCKAQKVRCDSGRPICGNCVTSNQLCNYDHEPGSSQMSSTQHLQQLPPASTDDSMMPDHTQEQILDVSPVPPRAPATNAASILANLQSFQATHVQQTRLSLQSSAVEVLAASSCGNGESYRNIARLETSDQWLAFRNAMSDAAMKENTYEVLVGKKLEPVKPLDGTPIEEYNEYIKQQAIFNRRNTALLGAIMPRLADQFRLRVQHIPSAATAWQVLEDVCQPRGSESAFKVYNDLHSITLQNSGSLDNYITRLEQAYNALNRVAHTPSEHYYQGVLRRQRETVDNFRVSTISNSPWSAAGASPISAKKDFFSNVFSDEMLSFLFLKNLGPDYRRWADTLCATGNIGGFGSGRRLGFADLARSAVEHERQSRASSHI